MKRLNGWSEAITPFWSGIMIASGGLSLFYLAVGLDRHVLTDISQALMLIMGSVLLWRANPKRMRLRFAKRVVTYIHRKSGTVPGNPHLLIESARLANHVTLMATDPDWTGLDDDG